MFIIGHLRGAGGRKVFPIGESNGTADELQGQYVGTITTRTGEASAVGTYIVESEQFSQKVVSIRKLTPKECWRLQGFPDWAFDRAKAAGVSNSQLYKQAGNAVTVPVVQHIAELFTSQTMKEDHS